MSAVKTALLIRFGTMENAAQYYMKNEWNEDTILTPEEEYTIASWQSEQNGGHPSIIEQLREQGILKCKN